MKAVRIDIHCHLFFTFRLMIPHRNNITHLTCILAGKYQPAFKLELFLGIRGQN
jgi:hypothetical protein